MNQIAIRLNTGKNRFQATVEGHLCTLDYELSDGVIHLNHVRVPTEVGGRGIASNLTRHALDHARHEGLKVVANCPYVKRWIDQHPEYKESVQGSS